MARSRVRIYSKRYLCQSLSRSSIFGGNCSNARVSSCGFAIVLPFRSTQYDSRNSIALPCQSDKRAHPFYQMLLGREMPVSRIATAQHLLHHRVHSFVAWMVALERRPAVGEDLLEDVLMGLTGRRHA